MSEPSTAPRKLWAAVVTGVTTPEGLPCFLSKDGNKVYPVPLFRHVDKVKVVKRAKSLRASIRQIRFYDGPGMIPSEPIIGVVEISLPPKQPMSPERIAKMQAGRKEKEGSTTEKHKPAAASQGRK